MSEQVKRCDQPQAHPDRCGCAPAGTEQVSSAWLEQLRKEYLQFAGACERLTGENASLAQRCRELEVELRVARDDNAVLEQVATDAVGKEMDAAKERDTIRATLTAARYKLGPAVRNGHPALTELAAGEALELLEAAHED